MTLSEKYQTTRRHTENLMNPLSVDDHLAQPAPYVSPPKWHLGHTTWFFETLILKAFKKDYRPFDEQFPYYFNSYYESLGERLEQANRGGLTRPSLERVYEYRAYVDEHMQTLLQKPAEPKMTELLELGLNHEQQHQELFLTDFKYILACQPFHPVYNREFSEGKALAEKNDFISFKEGLYEIGHSGSGFAYDNEEPRHRVFLEDFKIAQRLVTNAEWLEFINDGGYQDFKYWHADGWAWVQENNIKAPAYWEQTDHGWKQFSLSGSRDLIPAEAVSHVSFYEAAAFAEWKGLRLPTEAEWEVASDKLDWGQRWEWTNSAYLPYPGFVKREGPAGEYNGKFMVNQMVLRGASVATYPGHSRKTYRNFFNAPLRWQFTGLRLAE